MNSTEEILERLKRIEALLLLIVEDGEAEDVVTSLNGETVSRARDQSQPL